MIELAIDLETYSETDIKFGVHKYTEDPQFEILLLAYRYSDRGGVVLVDLVAGEEIPFDFWRALSDPTILKTAYNAAFEIACLNRYVIKPLDVTQWSCTQVLAAQIGLPFGLANVAKALGTEQQKDAAGKALIKYFTMPCKPSKANGMRLRNMPHHDFDKWLQFREYCIQDVLTEQDVRSQVNWFEICEFEKEVWALDQKINDNGVCVDMELVANAVSMDAILVEELTQEMLKLTNILNPKSGAQVKKYILESTGLEIESLNKSAIAEINAQFKGTDMEPILKIREKLSRTSIKKFVAIANSACSDNRVRDLFQYYGANRTGRWAGRNVQLQNLKRNDLKELDLARRLVKANDLRTLKLLYDDVGQVLSNLIRTAFISPSGYFLGVSDFSAIEARIIAWIADEAWRLEVFRTHGKIYEASAAMMFNIPIEEVTKPLRQKGKIAELALGYGGALGALVTMGGSAMGLSNEDMTAIVKSWRGANNKIVKLWRTVQNCAVAALQTGRAEMKYLKFYRKHNCLFIELPSGRCLSYFDAVVSGNSIKYKGMDQTTKQWTWQDTYGGKLVENIIQAIARDVLVDALLRVDAMDFKIVMHVHDEIVIERKCKMYHNEITEQVLEDTFYPGVVESILDQVLSQPVSWAPGLPLGAESFTTKYYQK